MWELQHAFGACVLETWSSHAFFSYMGEMRGGASMWENNIPYLDIFRFTSSFFFNYMYVLLVFIIHLFT